MGDDLFLAPDLFFLPGPRPATRLLYAPLLEVILEVNAEVEALVGRLQQGEVGPLDGDSAALVRDLKALGLASSTPYPDLAPSTSGRGFSPTSVSLFLTSRCNLGCTYCYASADESPVTIEVAPARAAIDLVIQNAVSEGRDTVGLIFHGGGEATVAWDLLRASYGYARIRTATRGLGLHTSIGTNGVMPPRRAAWLARNLDSATISVDGPPDVHDRWRPTRGGGSSYPAVLRTLSIFDREGLHYGVRMTVSQDWVHRLPEAVESITDACGVRQIQAEPLFEVGRAQRTGEQGPAAAAFIDAFQEAAALARARGVQLRYSGARLGTVTDRFCEAPGRSFAVTPDGRVSSCYEVSDPADERSEIFTWGHFDRATRRFALDEARRLEQTTLTVQHKPACSDCFCKWHCAGDCAAKLAHLGDARDPTPSPRCVVNRALTRDQLLRALELGETADVPLETCYASA
jgi:uncharacterized protein